MIPDSGAEFTEPKACECYKKLQLMGVPFHTSEEENSEEEESEFPEQAFRLPGILKIDDSFLDYPFVEQHPLAFVFEQMSRIIPNLADFDQNLLSFWMLDMFIEALSTAQSSGFPFTHQRATLLWVAYFFNYIQNNNPSRKEMFTHLKYLLLKPKTPRDNTSEERLWTEEEPEEFHFEDTVSFTTTETKVWTLPLPPGALELKFEGDRKLSIDENTITTTTDSEEMVASLNSSRYEIISGLNVKHMNYILEILYRIFGNAWVYAEIQAVFHGMPYAEKVHLPFQLHLPKPRLKYDSPSEYQAKTKNARKLSVKISESSTESECERVLHRNDYILPLMAADEAGWHITKHSAQSHSERSETGKGKKKSKD